MYEGLNALVTPEAIPYPKTPLFWIGKVNFKKEIFKLYVLRGINK